MIAKQVFPSGRRLLVSLGLALGMIAALGFSLGLASSDGYGVWTPTGGPIVSGGQVLALAVHPTISGTVYASVQSPRGSSFPSTIYKSTNGAVNWTALYTTSQPIQALVTTGTLVYAGDYNADATNLQPVIYRSADGGLSWTTPLSIANGAILALGVHPTLTTTAVAGGGDFLTDKAMLYRTTDGGLTWKEVFSYTKPGWGPAVIAVLIHPTTPLTWLLSHDGEVGGTLGSYIWRSTNGGAAWTKVYTLTEDIITSLIANSVTPTIIYAGTWHNNFYRSADGGNTWTAVITNGSAGERLVLDPPNTLYATRGNELRKSTDGGDSWSTAAGGLWGLQSLAIDRALTPTVLYAGLDERGVYKSTNGGVAWAEANSGIRTLLIPMTIAIDPQHLDKLYTAGGYPGGFRSTDGGATWIELTDVPYLASFAIHPHTPSVVFAGGGCDRCGSVYRSTDNGVSWTSVYTAPFITPDGSAGDEWIFALAIDPVVNSTIYAGGRDFVGWSYEQGVLLRSTDGGLNWTRLMTTTSAWPGFDALAVDPVRNTIVYAAGQECGVQCEGVIYRSRNRGDTWTKIFTTTSIVRSIVIDYQTPNVLYASADNYFVYKSTDEGNNWVVVRKHELPSDPPSGKFLAIDPYVHSHIYLAGWGYVAESTDGGLTWSDWNDPINIGMPGQEPQSLAVDNGTITQTLYVGLNGVWKHSRAAPLSKFRVYLPVLIKNF